MKILTTIFAAALSVLVQTACSQGSGELDTSDVTVEEAGELNVMFSESESDRFSGAERKLITDIVTNTETKVRALLPTLPKNIEVTIQVLHRNVDQVGGVTGMATKPGAVLIQISKLYPGGIAAAAKTSLASTIYHEFHHLDRGWTISGNKFKQGIPIAAVNEGLASVFSEQYSGVYYEAASGYPDNADEWLAEILALPIDADYGTWTYEHPDGRTSIGYRVGRYVVHQAMANSGKTILELSKLSPDEILEYAQQ